MRLRADRGVGDVGFVGWQRPGVSGGQREPVLLCGIRHAGQARIEGDRRLKAELTRDIAELQDAGHLVADRLHQRRAFVGGVGHPVKFLDLGDRLRGDVGGGMGGGGPGGRGVRVGCGRVRVARCRPVIGVRLAREGPCRQGGRTGQEVSSGGRRGFRGGSHVVPPRSCGCARAWPRARAGARP